MARRLATAPENKPVATSLSAGDERESRLNRLLAEIEALEDADVARQFLSRAAAIGAQTSSGQRELLTDSLILDVAAHIKNRRMLDERRRLLTAARMQLRRIVSEAARDVEARIAAALSTMRLPDDSERLLAQAKAVVDEAQKRQTAAAARQAVLRALATLGYQVREQMVTALAEGGRVVVRKPAATGYGVEVGSARDGERFQMRVVAFKAGDAVRNAARDADAERIWCSDVPQLRALLTEAGCDAELETALAPGAVPLKTVPMMDEHEERDTPREAPRRRSFDGS